MFTTCCRQLITVEPEHPKLSNVDLLQEMEQILAQQTPILAALEKQNYDNRVANGRVSVKCCVVNNLKIVSSRIVDKRSQKRGTFVRFE